MALTGVSGVVDVKVTASGDTEMVSMMVNPAAETDPAAGRAIRLEAAHAPVEKASTAMASRIIPQLALMVKVIVAAYEPGAYAGSSTRLQLTVALLPARFELAAAPKLATDVAAVVLAVCAPEQAVAGASAAQV
jgi:hypothetical protein